VERSVARVDVDIAEGEGDIAKSDGGGAGSSTVFAGSQEEKEGEPSAVDSRLDGWVGSQGCGGCDPVKELYWDGLYARGGWVGSGVGFEEPCEPWVHGASRRCSGIAEAQVGERLCDGKEFVAYALSADRVTAATGSAVPDALGQDEEDGYLVVDIVEEWRGDAQGPDVRYPVGRPETVGRGGASWSDGASGRCRCSAKVNAELTSGGRGSICQGWEWEEREEIKVRRSASVRSNRRLAMSAR
jgi:hypothetical protein